MGRIKQYILTAIAVICTTVTVSEAHFGAIIPSDDIVSQHDSKNIELEMKFIHPMEQHYMEMEKPKQFGVFVGGKKKNLIKSIKPAQGKSTGQKKYHTFWKADYSLKRPGDYTFFLLPAPYWEQAEDLFIVHYTKVCVNSLGLEQGWDEALGLETEIVPLTRPYGLWTGNIFTGRVLLDGTVVPNAIIEVEYLNVSPDNDVIITPPSTPFITQVVKADKNGVFSYAMPRAGWWGFSALNKASWKLNHAGEEKSVEIGAVYWVKTTDMK